MKGAHYGDLALIPGGARIARAGADKLLSRATTPLVAAVRPSLSRQARRSRHEAGYTETYEPRRVLCLKV